MSGAFFTPVKSILPLDGEGINIAETSEAASVTDTVIPETKAFLKIPYKVFCYNSDYEESSLDGGISYNITGNGYRMIDGNPWSEEQGITSLPVYENLSYGGDYVYPDCYLDGEAMKKMAEKAAEALGVAILGQHMGNDGADVYQNNFKKENAFVEGNPEFEYRQDEWYYNFLCEGEDYGVDYVWISVWSRGGCMYHLATISKPTQHT